MQIYLQILVPILRFHRRNYFWGPAGFYPWVLLFNILFRSLVSVVSNIDFESYADNNTSYVIGENTREVMKALENSFKELME